MSENERKEVVVVQTATVEGRNQREARHPTGATCASTAATTSFPGSLQAIRGYSRLL